MVFVIVHTPRPTSKGLDHPIFMSMLACFYAIMLVLASLVLGFATLGTLSGLVVVWLHSTPMRPCLYVCGFFFFFFSTQVQVETRILNPILIVLKNWAWFTVAKLG